MKRTCQPGWLQAAVLLSVLVAGSLNLRAAGELQMVGDRRWHLGRAGEAEWATFESRRPDGPRLELSFTGRRNEHEMTLFIRQDDVRHDWFVELNGRRLGRLFLMEADLVSTLSVPANALRDGPNELVIRPPAQSDDIVVGPLWLKPGVAPAAIAEATLRMSVIDADDGRALPARITLTDAQGTLVPLTAVSNQVVGAFAAIRPGVVYFGPKGAAVGLPAGEYTLHASRGFEYGVSTQPVRLRSGDAQTIELSIRREVATPGWISCDTHVHTLTHSGHGDATLDERMLTLAGEGIELPVATDHNFHADYREAVARVGVGDFFTPISGNEVTTGTAHFNIFPVQPSARVVDFRIGNGPALAAAMRETPGVKVVVLNHPLNVHNGFQPFAPTNFNNATGEHLGGPRFSFDALELISSSAQQSDFMAVFRGWFALLNHGDRVIGVGSSDGHDVSRYIVGQSRTYLAGDDANPGALDIDRACDALLAGRALVSMGLWVNLQVDDRFGVGDLATNLSEQVAVTVQVSGPSWVEATNVVLFANGKAVREQAVVPGTGRAGEKARVNWRLPRPAHDVHLVALATGPGVTAPYWAIPRPYQPTSRHWVGRVIGATNPVWLDADGDGRFAAAREYAQRLLDQHGTNLLQLVPALTMYDEAVAAQAASFLAGAGLVPEDGRLARLLADAPAAVKQGFQAYALAHAAARQ